MTFDHDLLTLFFAQSLVATLQCQSQTRLNKKPNKIHLLEVFIRNQGTRWQKIVNKPPGGPTASWQKINFRALALADNRLVTTKRPFIPRWFFAATLIQSHAWLQFQRFWLLRVPHKKSQIGHRFPMFTIGKTGAELKLEAWKRRRRQLFGCKTWIFCSLLLFFNDTFSNLEGAIVLTKRTIFFCFKLGL